MTNEEGISKLNRLRKENPYLPVKFFFDEIQYFSYNNFVITDIKVAKYICIDCSLYIKPNFSQNNPWGCYHAYSIMKTWYGVLMPDYVKNDFNELRKYLNNMPWESAICVSLGISDK